MSRDNSLCCIVIVGIVFDGMAGVGAILWVGSVYWHLRDRRKKKRKKRKKK